MDWVLSNQDVILNASGTLFSNWRDGPFVRLIIFLEAGWILSLDSPRRRTKGVRASMRGRVNTQSRFEKEANTLSSFQKPDAQDL